MVALYIATDKRGIHTIFFLFLHENICCGYSLVPTTYVFMRNKKDNSIFRMKKAPYLYCTEDLSGRSIW